MPDIAMCKNETCPSHTTCYRFLATPDQYLQSYIAFEPIDDEANCAAYIPGFGEKYER